MRFFESVDWVYIRVQPILWAAGVAGCFALGLLAYQYLPLNRADRFLATEQIALAKQILFDASGYAAVDEVLRIVHEAEIHLGMAQEMLGKEDYSSARSHAFLAGSLGEKALARSGHRGALDREANFFRLQGNVSVRRAGLLVWQSASLLESLQAGDTIKTASGSLAEIIYTDGRITTLGPSSLMEIRRAVADAHSERLDVVEILSGGTLQITPAPTAAPNSTHRVTAGTISAIASIHDTEMNVAFDAQARTTNIEVGQGAVRLTTPERELSVPPGTRIQVDAQGRPGLPQPILPGPRLLVPKEGRLFRYVNPKATNTIVAWTSVDGASGYRLEADSHPGLLGAEIVLANIKETSARLPPLAPGWWFWRVIALDDQGRPGRPSSVGSLQIAHIMGGREKDDTPPELVIAEVMQAGSIVILTGTTEVFATLMVQGRWVMPEEDGKFTATIHFPHPGKNTITTVARDLAGNVTTVRRDVYIQE